MADEGSVRSGTSGTSAGMSETSSQRSDAKALKKLQRSKEDQDEDDILEQKRSMQEGVYSCMYTLVNSKSILSTWQLTVVRVILEGLCPFIVAFNPSIIGWNINTANPVWQIVRWTVWRSPIMRLYGYSTYILVMYIVMGIILVAVGSLVWLTLAMRKAEHSKWLLRAVALLRVVYDIIFVILSVSFFDYLVFTANCNFSGSGAPHNYFMGVECFAFPHVLHMSVALSTALLHFCVTALMVVASSDLNPTSKAFLASPDAYTRLKVLLCKTAFVIAADMVQAWPKWQVGVMLGSVALIYYLNLRKLPFYRAPVNCVWTAEWLGVLYTVVLLAVYVYGKDHSAAFKDTLTSYVLYGIFPVIAGGAVLCAGRVWWAMRSAKKFAGISGFADVRAQRKVHKFDEMHEVEILSRVVRKWDDDGVVTEEAAATAEVVIKAGMLAFSNKPFLHILYANFLLAVRKDGPGSRTHLQLAGRHAPTLVERYQIYCTMATSKRLKDSGDGGMDLQAYIEFKRNFRAVIRVHKSVLSLEAELWRMCLRSQLRVAEIDHCLDELESATTRANQVYKRVLERYPTNGKLLRCYGRFLEDVRHDHAAAARVYGDAARHGGGDAIMSLDLSSVQQATDKPEFLTSMSIQDDAVIVINAQGIIMMVSQAVQSVFGYAKAELEGANISLLMPQPFSQRHNGYLQRYVSGGEPHILDTVREVVALHKDHFVFPLTLCVTKMSGTGSDSMFLGVVRPLPQSLLRIRAWVSPNGTFLCGDQQFASLCGIAEKDLVGRSLASLCDTPEAEVNALLERFREATGEELEAGGITTTLLLKHRYLADPVPVEVIVGLAGTAAQRIMALTCRRTDGLDGNMVVLDSHMRLRFASLGVATLLNYPMRRLGAMRLDELLPAPFDTLHAKWIKEPPHEIPKASCRAGRVVHLVNSSGVAVPVRIKISSTSGSDTSSALYVVEIEKVAPGEVFEEKKLVLTADLGGAVLGVSRPASELFGFPASELVGRSLCDTVDIFEDWRARNGDSQLQLLMLALLDKEQEIPGTSWRVRMHRPKQPGEELDTGTAKKKPAEVSHSACLQAEVIEGEDAGGGSGEANVRIRLTLWRRDLLTGVLELDERLVVRRASPLTGLIVGVPATSMMKRPLQKYLAIPTNKTWDEIAAAATHKRSSLKATGRHGVVGPRMAFIGPHPDAGTMRILVQGVQQQVPGAAGRTRPATKVTVVLHPDTMFQGAHANLLRVLHLEGVGLEGEEQQQLSHHHHHHHHHHEDAAGSDGHAEGEAQLPGRSIVGSDSEGGGRGRARSRSRSRSSAGGVGEHSHRGSGDELGDVGSEAEGHGGARRESGPDVEAQNQAKLHRIATNKSDFVAKWVRTVSKQASSLMDTTAERPGTHGGAAGSGAEAEGLLAHMPALPSPPDSPQKGKARGKLDEVEDGGDGSGQENAGGDAGGEGNGNGSEGGDSSAEGSQAASGITSITDAQSTMEVMVDARRGKLLKSLRKVLMGPELMRPLDRLRLQSYLVLLVMLVAHTVCYAVIRTTVAKEHTDVYLVQRQALAMDRAQLLVVRVLIGTYCERANITDRTSACTPKLPVHINSMKTSIREMEEYHQGIYLGFSATDVHAPQSADVMAVWTRPHWDYELFLDTSPPMVVTHTTGVWQLGNRFLAAAREAVYWMPILKDKFKFHRVYQYLVTNGLSTMFSGYARSLDLLMSHAWQSLDELRTVLVVVLVAEVLVVQLLCLLWQWLLAWRVEGARLLGVVAMVGLPSPVLRQMASRDIKITEDSDDDDDVSVEDGDTHGAAKGPAAEGGSQHGTGDPASGAAVGVSIGDGNPTSRDEAGRAATLKFASFEIQPTAGAGEEVGSAAAGGVAAVGHEITGQPSGGVVTPVSKGGGRKAARRNRVGGQVVNGKVLVPSPWRTVKFMLLPVCWFVGVLAVYAASLYMLQGMQGPLASLNMASHVVYRYTRVRAVGFAFLSQDDAESRSLFRDMLRTEVRHFTSEYNALMYGGTALSQATAEFQHPVPASTFASRDFANAFFRTKRCFRFNQTLCAKEGSPWYEVTHNGLDTMVRRMVAEMELLLQDDDADVRYNASRWTYMYNVGTFDLYEGLQQAAQLFVDYSISRYNRVITLHTILLVCTLGVFLPFVFLVLWPHVAKLRGDAARQSALLSHVPPEVDTLGHVRATCRRAKAGREGRGAAAAKRSTLSIGGGGKVLPDGPGAATGV